MAALEMNRVLKWTALVAGTLILVLAFLASWASYAAYFSHSRQLSSFMRAIPDGEQAPPASFKRAVERVHPNGIVAITMTRVAARVVSKPQSNLEHAGLEVTWRILFPRFHSRAEVLAAYANTMVFEAGHGLESASEYYFHKKPGALTDEEALALVVMDINPHGYSMRMHPERLREAMQRY
jgi:hypothetical protein